jgi:hypothetical protein
MIDQITITETGALAIDPDAVNPGDYIEASVLAEVLGFGVNDVRYGLELLRLADRYETDRGREGKPAMVKREQNGLRVLTAPEAAEYGDRRFWAALSGARRTHERCVAAVGAGQLTAEERERHDRVAAIRARVLAAIAKDQDEAERRLLPAREE